MRFHPTPGLAKEIKYNNLDKSKLGIVVYKRYMRFHPVLGFSEEIKYNDLDTIWTRWRSVQKLHEPSGSFVDELLYLIYLEEDVDASPNLGIVWFEFIVHMPDILGAAILTNQLGMQPFLVKICIIYGVFMRRLANGQAGT